MVNISIVLGQPIIVPSHVDILCLETFAEALRQIRKSKYRADHKFTTVRLAKLSGFSKTRINDFEKGILPRYIEVVESLARKMRCSELETARLKAAFYCDHLKKLGYEGIREND